MTSILKQEFIRVARAKGLSGGRVMRDHALRNAMIPVLTILGLQFSFLLAGAVIIGIVLAAAIQQLTGYFTETNRRPVDDVAKSSLTGPATVILSGISLGLESAVYSALPR